MEPVADVLPEEMLCRIVLATLCITIATTVGQEPARPRPEDGRPPGPRPWDQDVAVFRVASDGTSERLAVFERAGVATITRLADGRLVAAHQHFPERPSDDFDKVAVHFSSDDGRTWTPPQMIQLTGLPEGMRFPFDPTVVPLADGRVRLYFTSVERVLGRDRSPPAIYSAISTDAVRFEFEPGCRFSIEGRPVIDCAVVLHQGTFHLYSPDNGAGLRPDHALAVEGRGYHAVSSDGLDFRRVEDVRNEGRGNWLGCATSDGKVITFFGTGRGIWTGTSEDGAAWKAVRTLGVRGADPGVVVLPDGTLIVVATTGPRRDTPSARPGAN